MKVFSKNLSERETTVKYQLERDSSDSKISLSPEKSESTILCCSN